MSVEDSRQAEKESLTVLVSAVSSVLGGGITVVQSLTRSMALCRPHHHFVLICAHEEVADFEYPTNVEVIHLPHLKSRPSRWLWEQKNLPVVAGEKRADVILALGGYLSFRCHVPQISVWQNPNVFSPPGIRRPLRMLLRDRYALRLPVHRGRARKDDPPHAVTPGGVKTPMWEKEEFFKQLMTEHGGTEGAFAAMAGDAPSHQFYSPEEVAKTILYLASDESSHLTGTEIVLDRGHTR